jgi:hypothetical protein
MRIQNIMGAVAFAALASVVVVSLLSPLDLFLQDMGVASASRTILGVILSVLLVSILALASALAVAIVRRALRLCSISRRPRVGPG